VSPTLSRRGWGAAALLWLLLAFIQGPGLTVADTKHDLTADPWGFLHQALSPWTDVFPLGQLQNQAYGYLFPQGLFFALLEPLPDWVAQRLWWSLLLFLAFAGVVKLLEATATGSRASRLIAAVLFALSPRILTTLGAISSEAWTIALVLWVMLPVVRVLRLSGRPTTRHLAVSALGSAVAVLCLGAVNAVATVAAVMPAVIWWLTQGVFARGDDAKVRRRTAWRFAAWWVPGGVLACFWWIGPLLILGRYSPPFTDYIESSGITSYWFNLGEVLRGTTSWTAFLSSERQAGYAMVTEAVFVAATLIIALVGLAGLAGARLGRVGRSREPLPFAVTWILILGSGLTVFGLAGAPFSPVADQVQSFLDGSGAPLRNLHKFDAQVHLPLIVGVAHLLGGVRFPSVTSVASLRENWAHPEKNPPVVTAIATGLVVAVATAPAWTGRLVPEDGFRGVPSYWNEAADWLNDPANGAASSRTMVLPEARFARQTWGNTRDEPAQALLDVPWVVRDSVPLVPPEAIRGIDGLTREFSPTSAAGRNPALADALLQQGVGMVMVRTDLTSTADTPGARGVLRTLTESAASDRFTEVASFGDKGSDGSDGSEGDDDSGDGVRIFRVDGSAQTGDSAPENSTEPRVVARDDLEVTAGGPEALPRLAAADAAAGSRPRDRILTQDAEEDEQVSTITDTPALRDHNYGNITGATSEILSPDDPRMTRNPVRDYPSGVPEEEMTHVRESGGRVTASSSASDPTSLGGAENTSGVSAAVDEVAETAWRPGSGSPINQKLNFELDEPRSQMSLSARAAGGPLRVQATTYLGEKTVASTTMLIPDYREESSRPLVLPQGRADRVELRIVGAWGNAGISEAKLTDLDTDTDVTPRRDIVVPGPAGSRENPGRWVLGQEINEFEMRRTITVPETTDVTVDSDRCAADSDTLTSVDGEEVSCGQTLTLTAGEHEVRSRDRWLSLTTPEAATHATAGGADSTESGSASESASEAGPDADDRIIVTATSVNEGRKADVDGTELEPVTVNGWQQGWSVPADSAAADLSDDELVDALNVEFTATDTYQHWLIAGLVGALVLLLGWVSALVVARRRQTDTELSTPGRPHVGATGKVIIGAATLSLAAGIAAVPGALVAAATIGVITATPALLRTSWISRLPGRVRALVGRLTSPVPLAMVLGGLGSILMVRSAWGSGNYSTYAGNSWAPELLFIGCLVAVVCAVIIRRDDRDDR
jgi:arabinofuranan 3-O-arabinosyltransferase